MLMWWYALWAYESFRWDLLAKRSALYDYRKAAFIHQVFLFIFYYKWSWKTAQLHFNLKTSPKCCFFFFLVILFFHCFFSFLLTQCHFFSIVIVYFTPFSKYYKSAWAVFPSKGYSVVDTSFPRTRGSWKACGVTIEITWFCEKEVWGLSFSCIYSHNNQQTTKYPPNQKQYSNLKVQYVRIGHLSHPHWKPIDSTRVIY